MTNSESIVVYGATGLTGGLVIEALIARKHKPILAGRNESKLRALAERYALDRDAVVVADPSNPASIARAVERGRAVIACAGPFLEVGEPTVAACATHGVFYTDSTGEAPFVQMVARRYDATARANDCALAPSMAFEVAVADAAVARAAQDLGDQVDVEVAYGLVGGATSRGTRASMAMVLARPGMAYFQGQTRNEPIAAHVKKFTFQSPQGVRSAASFASPEVVTVPRHVKARSVRVYMANSNARTLRVASRAITPLVQIAQPLVRRLLEGAGSQNPSASELASSRFQVVAIARSQDGSRERTVTVTGSNGYTLSGSLLAEAAIAMVQGKVRARGMIAPVQVLGIDATFDLVRAFEGGNVIVEER